MNTIRFPNDMPASIIEEESILMFYNPKTTDGEPNSLTIQQIRELFTGKILDGEKAFVTGGSIALLIKDGLLRPDKSLDGKIVLIDKNGEMANAGNFEDLQKTFNENIGSKLG